MISRNESVSNWIDDHKDRFIDISDKIWKTPELGLIEFKSAALLSDELEKHGFLVKRNVAGMPTAFIATWGKGRPILGIMGEYDALPGLSQKKLPWKEPLKNGISGHGCGHNIHGTSGMAAALAVKDFMEGHLKKGTLKFFGCPAEENFSGKVFMINKGCFDGMEAIISHHPDAMNSVNLRSSLAVNSVKFHFHGKSSHAGGSPEQGRSALDGIELMNTGVNYLREHIVQDARIHYVIEKGGDQPNVVPSYSRSWYYVRAPNREQLKFIYDWILEIAEGAAKMTRTKTEIEFLEGCSDVVPNKTIANLIVENMKEIGLPKYSKKDMSFAKKIAETISLDTKSAELKKTGRPGWQRLIKMLIDEEIPEPWGDGQTMHGSTDVGDVSWLVPTVEFSTATWVVGTPAHSWQAVAQSGVGLGHKSLLFSAKVIATTITDLFNSKQLLRKAQQEYKQRIGNRKYESPIPQNHKPPLDHWDK
jgi:aminobenzoyl-glutamate utilization protein B